MHTAVEYSWSAIALGIGAFVTMYVLSWIVIRAIAGEHDWRQKPPIDLPKFREGRVPNSFEPAQSVTALRRARG